MKKLALIMFGVLFLLSSGKTFAQITTAPQKNSPAWGDTKFIITGGGMINFSADDSNNSFGNTGFHIMPMAKIGNRMYLLSEIEIGVEDGAAPFELETTNLYYQLNKYMIIHAGRFLPKFGNYRGRFGSGFINRFANDPVGFGDGGIGPLIETGVGVQGGVQLGSSKINYDFYISGGPQLLVGSEDAPEEAGQFEYEAYDENNNNKAFGGRIGLLPYSNSSLEIGLSGEIATSTGDSGTPAENVSFHAYALDVTYYKVINGITLRLMGAVTGLDVGNFNYVDFSSPQDSLDNQPGTYTFDNSSNAFYTQIALRPSGANNHFVSNLEFAGRYSFFDRPEKALWGGENINQLTFGINYYFSWSNILKFTYNIEDNGTADQFLAQLIFRF